MQCLPAQIGAAAGARYGVVIWGHVARQRGLFLPPNLWRRHLKPSAKALAVNYLFLTVLFHAIAPFRTSEKPAPKSAES